MKYDVMARRVRSGILWTRGAEFVHAKAVGPGQLGMCWKQFYHYKQFAWLPNEMIPGWRPSCPNEDCHCDTTSNLSVHMRTIPPRCVYGLVKNYMLDSPVQWICKSCQKKSLNEEAVGVPKDGRTQYTFLNTDRHILKELKSEHPDVFALFPCYLTHKSAIDRKIGDLLLHCNEKGMGPTCVAQLIKCWHWEHKDERELQWIHYVLRRIRQPLPGETINKGSIARFPDYDSDEICGRTPSQSYLTDVFCMINLDKKIYMTRT